MKNKIPMFLKERLKMKFSSSKQFPEEIKQFMIDYSLYYGWKLNENISTIFKVMKTGLSNLEKCEYTGCINKKMIRNCDGVISKGCCVNHSKKITNLENSGFEHNWSTGSSLREKQEETMMSKYGVKHNFQHGKLRDKAKETMIDRYGVDHNWKRGELRERDDLNLVEKYEHYTNKLSENILKKREKTCLKVYGYTNPMKNTIIQSKGETTCLLRYGYTNPSKIQLIKAKKSLTCLKHFGVENPMQNAEIFEKAQQNSFRRKEYIWTSGEISLLQGYEPIVLKELENDGYKFNDILTSPKDMPEITYFFEGKEHRYYPDFYIPSENKIIEVKSDYTLQADWDKNQAKFEATRNLGFDFILEVR